VRAFLFIRHVVIFLLGTLIIIDGLRQNESSIPKLIIGMIMVGVLPLENLTLLRPIEFKKRQSIDDMPLRDVERNHEAPE
jgi:hypothetical protein